MQGRDGISQASWNCILSATLRNGQPHKTLQVFRQMQQEGVSADSKTFVITLQACCKIADMEDALCFNGSLTIVDPLHIGRALHADARGKGVASHRFVGSTLLNLYGKYGNITGAENVFAQMREHDVVSWTTLLAAYAEHGHGQRAMHMFKQMLEGGVVPNERTFLAVIQACCTLAEQEEGTFEHGRSMKMLSLKIGQALHEDTLRNGYADVYIDSALVSMYGKCGHLVQAEQVFYEMSWRDVVAWNTMLSAYVEQEEATKALQLFNIMQKAGDVSPNDLTFVIAFQACCILAEKEQGALVEGLMIKAISLEIGQALHCDARMCGLASHVSLGSTLISMYSMCGSILDAETVFDGLCQRVIMPWNAMLWAYVDQDQGDKALSLYQQMLDEGVSPNDLTFNCILSACSETGCVEVCRQVHCGIVSGCDVSAPMATTLVHVYGGCASMEDAKAAFNTLCCPDIVSWNALCAGHAREGNHIVCVQTFDEMRLADIKPDDVSFLSVLSVCNHSGLVDIGIEYVKLIRQQFGKILSPKHFNSVVDLLGRAGDFIRVDSMWLRLQVQPDLAAWLCLLRACQTHGNVSLGRWAFDRVVLLQRKEASAYVLMSNIYAEAGLWDDACRVEKIRQIEGV
eukprot:c24449_g2_i1 orf=537-2423(-)